MSSSNISVQSSSQSTVEYYGEQLGAPHKEPLSMETMKSSSSNNQEETQGFNKNEPDEVGDIQPEGSELVPSAPYNDGPKTGWKLLEDILMNLDKRITKLEKITKFSPSDDSVKADIRELQENIKQLWNTATSDASNEELMRKLKEIEEKHSSNYCDMLREIKKYIGTIPLVEYKSAHDEFKKLSTGLKDEKRSKEFNTLNDPNSETTLSEKLEFLQRNVIKLRELPEYIKNSVVGTWMKSCREGSIRIEGNRAFVDSSIYEFTTDGAAGRAYTVEDEKNWIEFHDGRERIRFFLDGEGKLTRLVGHLAVEKFEKVV